MAIRPSTVEGVVLIVHPNPAFWHGKRVLLTGHTGFKGSWLSLWLQSMGAQVLGYALAPPSQPNLFDLAQVGTGMTSVIGDIRDLTALQKTFTTFQPEIVFHLAAQPLVRYSYQHPVETYATNVMGTVHVLEAVRHTPSVKAVVNITTDKCYENRESTIWDYRENDALGGHDPYSNSKACAELVSAAYRSSFFNVNNHQIALATVRAGNVIGGGDWAQDRLIPDILDAFAKGKMLHIRHPHAIRPWQHVMEPLRGYLMLAEQLAEYGSRYAEAWNFGPKDEDAKPVSWIVEQIAAMWNDKDIEWQIDQGDHPHEATYLKLNIAKARNLLGWHPTLSLQAALQLTIDWARQHQAGTDMRQVTLEQIHAYQALASK